MIAQKGTGASHGLYGISFNKLKDSDCCVTLPVAFSTVYGFSQAHSSLIVVRKEEICPSRRLCLFYCSIFVSAVLLRFVILLRFLLSVAMPRSISVVVTYSCPGKAEVEREVVSCGVSFFSLPETTGLSTSARWLRFLSALGSLILPACVSAEHKNIWLSFEVASSGVVCILQPQQ